MAQYLYLQDSYIKEFDAVVTEVSKEKFIVLDKAGFYPQSGGQASDTGTIKKGDNIFKVVFCGKFDEKVSHEVDKPGLNAGDKVHCILDWNRRYKLMRSHTAAHIICEVINRETGALITGNQLNIDQSRIDFSLENYDTSKLQDYIAKANDVVNQDLPIKVEFVTRDDIINRPNITKLAKGLPESIKDVRLLYIGEFDVQADGGTHVKSTKEVGKIELVKTENKGKNNRRLYFKLND